MNCEAEFEIDQVLIYPQVACCLRIEKNIDNEGTILQKQLGSTDGCETIVIKHNSYYLNNYLTHISYLNNLDE